MKMALAVAAIWLIGCQSSTSTAIQGHSILFTNSTTTAYDAIVLDSVRRTLYGEGSVPQQSQLCVILTTDNQSNPITDNTVLAVASTFVGSTDTHSAYVHVAPNLNWTWDGTAINTSPACHP